MDQQPRSTIALADRARFVVYGMAGGLLVGIIVGWMLHGIIGLILKLLLIVAIVVPVVAAILFWQKVSAEKRDFRSRAVVSEAQWREMDAKPRSSGGVKR